MSMLWTGLIYSIQNHTENVCRIVYMYISMSETSTQPIQNHTETESYNVSCRSFGSPGDAGQLDAASAGANDACAREEGRVTRHQRRGTGHCADWCRLDRTIARRYHRSECARHRNAGCRGITGRTRRAGDSHINITTWHWCWCVVIFDINTVFRLLFLASNARDAIGVARRMQSTIHVACVGVRLCCDRFHVGITMI